MRGIVSGIMLMLLLMVIFSPALNIKSTKAEWTGTVYIRADGSIDPPEAPIITYDKVVYNLTEDIIGKTDGIVIERDNIILDGACHVIRGWRKDGKGIRLEGNNVTIKNTEVTGFADGIWIEYSSNNTISENNITDNYYSICIWSGSSGNIISKNNIINNGYGIWLRTSNNRINGNNFVNNGLFVESYPNFVEDNTVNGKPLVYLEFVSNFIVDNAGQVILIGCENIIVKNLNISKATIGIHLWGTYNSTILGNYIANNADGILLESSSNNSINGNNIENNFVGISLDFFSNYNIISGNNLTANRWCAIKLTYSSNNSIFHNNFIIKYTEPFTTRVYTHHSINYWDDDYPSGGNYWSDYAGVDLYSGPYQNETGSDGMGDTPYVIDANNVDRYPLMAPFKVFEAQHWDGLTYNFHVISNSTILNFELFESLIPEIPSKISLNVSGPDNTNGFCRITIPNIIVQDLWQNNYMVLLNGEPYPFKNWTDSENTYIYINYTHSTHEIVIIPEYPSTIILTIFMLTTTVLAVLTRNRRLKHRR
jgi:parallel beta-helix repeat protein